MKIYHFYMVKAPLCLIGYLAGHDMTFLVVAALSALCIPLFAYFNE